MTPSLEPRYGLRHWSAFKWRRTSLTRALAQLVKIDYLRGMRGLRGIWTPLRLLDRRGSDRRNPVRPFYCSIPAMPQVVAARTKLILGRLDHADGKGACREIIAQLMEVPPLLAHAF